MHVNPDRILLHRLGSLGDTLVTLPIFHLLERRWPNAEKRVLTNSPINAKAPPLWSVLGQNNFIDGHFSYRLGTRNVASLWSLIRDIRRWGPDIIVYANPIYSRSVLWRDRAFLGLCGAQDILGLGAANLLEEQPVGLANGIVPSMASHISSGLSELGDFEIENSENWSLRLVPAEREAAMRTLANWEGRDEFVAFSIGTKWPENDWGDTSWQRVFDIVSGRKPGVGLVAVGASGESDRSAQLLEAWRGPTLNCCGSISPRESAGLIERAVCFAGHDSGPMHLAAAVMTPTVSVFSLKNPPGLWFPHGKDNRIFYPGLAWSGGNPAVTRNAAGEINLSSIPADAVAEACIDLFDAVHSGHPQGW
jgi:heptosyltransferase-3